MSQQPIILDTPEQINFASVLALRSALRLQTKGLKMSRGASALSIARSRGFTNKRTAQGALDDMNAMLAEYGY
jgi:hypothetical protein